MKKLDYICLSGKGRVRSQNQDNYICDGQYRKLETFKNDMCLEHTIENPGIVFFGVYDGMGGEDHGEAASFIAAETAASMKPDSAEAIISFCNKANDEICTFTRENGLNVCGTTAAMVLISGDTATICNLGDSRVYRLRNRTLTQLSVDHSMPVPGRKKAPLVQFLGIPEDELKLEPHIISEQVKSGDVYLICSDGITDMVTEEDIEKIISEGTIFEAGRKLYDTAMEAGGKDNATAILINADGRKKGLFAGLKALFGK